MNLDDDELKTKEETCKSDKIVTINKDLIDAKKLIRLLSCKRSDNYVDWVLVGWALYNISDTLFDDFIWFSQSTTTKVYDKSDCIKVWKTADKRIIGLKELNVWAKEDNPEEYTKYLRENISAMIKSVENSTHEDCASILYEMSKYEFKCSSIEKNDLHELKKDKWIKIDNILKE